MSVFQEHPNRLRIFLYGTLVLMFVLTLLIVPRSFFKAPRIIPLEQRGEVPPFEIKIDRTQEELIVETVPGEEEGGQYLTVFLDIKNISNQERTVHPSLFSVVDIEGVEFLPVCRLDLTVCTPDQGQTLANLRLGPNKTASGFFVFRIDTPGIQHYLRVFEDKVTQDSVLFELPD